MSVSFTHLNLRLTSCDIMAKQNLLVLKCEFIYIQFQLSKIECHKIMLHFQKHLSYEKKNTKKNHKSYLNSYLYFSQNQLFSLKDALCPRFEYFL